MNSMVMLAEVQFRMIPILVAVRELIVFAIESVGYIIVAAAASTSIDLENDVVAYPAIVGTVGPPPYGGPFSVRFVANVFLEVHAVVYALLIIEMSRSANLQGKCGQRSDFARISGGYSWASNLPSHCRHTS
jgi:hypothetical protein